MSSVVVRCCCCKSTYSLFNPNACASYLLFLLCVRLAEYPRTHTIGTDAGAIAEFDETDGGYYVEFDADYDE